MNHLPLLINCRHRSVLLAGGGKVAARKAQAFIQAGASLHLVAERLAPAMRQLLDERNIQWQRRCLKAEDVDEHLLKGFFLVCAATSDPELNDAIAAYCLEHGILCNHAGRHQHGDVVMPVIRRRGAVMITVSIDGGLPIMARQIADYVHGGLLHAHCRLAELAVDVRSQARRRYPSARQQKRFWDCVLLGSAARLAFAGDLRGAQGEIKRLLSDEKLLAAGQGEVYLVGAGPGDPELLTVKALRLIQQAQTVVYDRLVSREIMELLPADVERIYAGKVRSQHTLPQQDINRLLVGLAHSGKRVLRLKGGDPLTFGRGGEEVQTLLAERVPFQLIPGITAASGCAAYAGIPLTHRDYAHACILVAGYLKDGSVNLDWEILARPRQTIVFYMGSQVLEIICERLIRHGLPEDTPAALISQGTLPSQRVVASSLRHLPEAVKKSPVDPPTLIIVGEVVRLHEVLRWYGKEDDSHQDRRRSGRLPAKPPFPGT